MRAAAGRAALAIAAAAAVVVAGQLVERPADERSGTPTASAQPVAVTESDLVCPGAPLAGLEGVKDIRVASDVAGQAPPPERVGVPPVTGQTGAGELAVRTPGDSATTAEPGERRVAARGDLGDGALVVGEGERAAGLVAAQQAHLSAEGAVGGSVAPCTTARADQWVVAGGGGAGRQERLVLVNPGENPVSVDLTSFAPTGSSRPTAGQGVVVAPRSRTVLLLDGVTGGRLAQVLRVNATGGPIGVWVVDHWVSGLTPRGLEIVPATTAPARRQVLGAVPKADKVRVVLGAPGSRDAIVTVRAIDDERGHAVGVVTVPAGGTAAIEVPDQDGMAALSVEADEPVVAAAEIIDLPDGGGTGEVAWSVATPPVDDLAGAAVPAAADGLERRLEISAPWGRSEVEVLTVTAGRTRVEPMTLDRDRSAVVGLGDAEAVWVRRVSGEAPHASMLTSGRAGGADVLSVTPLLRARTSDPSLDVVPLP